LSLSELSGATFENNEVEYTLIGNIENDVNNAPTLEKAITNQTATQNTTFSFTFAEDTFKDIDVGDSLSYSATLENGSPLPSWLIFDTATRTFSGTPSNADVANIHVKLVALDKTGATATTTFGLGVINVNDAPVAIDDAAITLENQAVTISATKLLVNDKDTASLPPFRPLNDFAFFTVNGNIFKLADVNGASNISNFFNSETGDRTFSYTFTESSIYKVGIGVVDIDDFTNTSALQIREASLTSVIQSVPEPSVALGSWLVIGFGTVFQGKRSKIKANKRVSSKS
jgi:Putative Ig domain